jgi:hypothetical protein
VEDPGASLFVLQPAGDGADSHVDEDDPATNYGSATEACPELRRRMIAARDVVPGPGGNTTERHAYLQFDLSAIPGGSTVESAILRSISGQALTLYCRKGSSASGLATEV